MATISKGYEFGATEQVTAAKLHSLVDSATISSIATADISNSAITDAKINDVSGAKFTGLANIPLSAGDIPEGNLPSLAAVDINGGSIDGVTIGAAVAPTVTNIDINGGTVDGVSSLSCATGAAVTEISTDGTLGGNSDAAIPTEKAVKTYADASAKTTVVAVDSVYYNSSTSWSNPGAGAWVDLSGLSVSITTTLTSTFYGVAYLTVSIGGDIGSMDFRIVRDSTSIGSTGYYDGTTSYNVAISGSEASVAAGTYTMKVQGRGSNNGSLTVVVTGFMQITAIPE